MTHWLVEQDKAIAIHLEVGREPYQVKLLHVSGTPTSSGGYTVQVSDKQGNKLTMQDRRMLPALVAAQPIADHITRSMPPHERFHWMSIMDGALRLQQDFEQWHRTQVIATTTTGTVTLYVVPGNHDVSSTTRSVGTASFAQTVLSKFFAAQTTECLLGCLDEEYHATLHTQGKRAADWQYVTQLIRSVFYQLLHPGR